MTEPRLYTSNKEIDNIKKFLKQYDWYADAYQNIKSSVDSMLKKGFEVPKESGFVFFDSCSRDNARLIFDPYRPNDHICPVCGMNYKDKPFQRAWVLSYHSWLSQMSILLGIVYLIDGDEAYAKALRTILLDYAKYYHEYPNNDNELGPTRVFQSTYMESVWDTYLAGAYDMVRSSLCFTKDDCIVIENDLFRASAEIIMDYDEKMNNRQAFNNAAICSIGFLLEDRKLIDYALYGTHGFIPHMNKSVLEDGLWYEGDNYHFATLPSIVNIAEVCRHNGLDFYLQEFNGHSIKMMFEAPLMSLQPDLTFPSRKDSRYANHIAQRWYAGLYELAYTRYRDPLFAKILKIAYSYNPPKGFDPPSAAGIMDVFRAEVARRNRLDWRGFLNATPELGEDNGLPVTRSINMTGTGLAVLRKNNSQTYVSLDYGRYGGGHGHPDRLNLNFFAGGHRWLSDWGTGNYYFDHLHWYRSTIAHNTVGVDGHPHMQVDGRCNLFQETSMVSIASAEVVGIAPGVDMSRTVILLDNDLLFDFVSVNSNEPHQYHYALHSFGELVLEEENLEPAQLHGDNYSFIKEIYRYTTGDNWSSKFQNKDASLVIRMIGQPDTVIYKGKAYGPPDQIPTLFPVLVVERNKTATDFVTLMESVESKNDALVLNFSKLNESTFCIECRDNIRYVIIKAEEGWAVLIYNKKNLVSLHSFGLKEVQEYMKFMIPLSHFECIFEENECRVVVPELFGNITFSAELIQSYLMSKNKVLVNGKNVALVRVGNAYVVKQDGKRYAKVGKNKLFVGIENLIDIELYNFTNDVWKEKVQLDLPAGWELLKTPHINVAPFSTELIKVAVICNNTELLSTGNETCNIRFNPTGDIWNFEVGSPVEIDEWIPRGQGRLFKIFIKNVTDLPVKVECSLEKESFVIDASKAKELVIPFEMLDIDPDQESISIPYTLKVGSYIINRIYSKALTKAVWIKRNIPIDSFAWKPNIHLQNESQVRRGEKHWEGLNDLSAEAMVCADDKGLILKVKVKDNCVLFSGGKFFFDNDSIQVYFDRRTEKYRNVDSITPGVYGFVVIPGVFDNSSSIKAVGTDIGNLDSIGVSTYLTADGYEMLLDIPWECIGGRPESGDLWGFDLIVNDRDSGVRRDLQMVWSGCMPGERTYLMQQYHNPKRFGLLLF
ncbi:MAG: heparinase II/III family protein [Firmicutes bacterium]|nr:heparinase II/III family protein [Bacillota bacterium]